MHAHQICDGLPPLLDVLWAPASSAGQELPVIWTQVADWTSQQ